MALVSVPIDESTLAVVRHWAKVSGITEAEFIRAAVLAYDPAPPRDLPDDPWTPVNVHAVYQGIRTEGQFVTATSRLTVTSGALAGRSYGNPTAAASAVVRAQNPRRSGHSDGWRFWKVNGDGKPIDALRAPRRRPPGDAG